MASKKTASTVLPPAPLGQGRGEGLRYLVGPTPILHGGVLYPPGSPIDLSAPQGERLHLIPYEITPTTSLE
ncbi:MAG: hypothetical protein IPN53_15295 [Comamonadaceae bacterium]|nr:hypothetical protein [Comamonadaceae bacterium]